MPAYILQQLPLASSMPAAGLWKRLWNLLPRRPAHIESNRFSMRLGAGQELRLREAGGWTVACLGGSVWITQEADTRDIFLNIGESFTLDRSGLALILARRESTLAIRSPADRSSIQTESPQLDAGAAPARSAREVWLRALYPECGPWNDPAAYRRSGLL